MPFLRIAALYHRRGGCLRTRQDVYSGYTQGGFEEALREHFEITDVACLPKSERVLYPFCHKQR